MADAVGEIIIPPAVRAEVVSRGAGATELAEASWVTVRQVSDPSAVQRLGRGLDAGEAEAIALTVELDAVLLLDERRGRRRAAELGLARVGTAGFLVYAKRLGFIEAVAPLLAELQAAGIFLGQGVIRAVLILAGEES